MKKEIVLIVLLVFSISGFAQESSDNSGFNLGVRVGVAQMMTEVTSDFRKSITEFDNKPCLAADLELSKLLFNHFEVGTNLFLTKLSGTADNPQEFTCYGIHHDFTSVTADPVEYNNLLYGQKFFVGYYFRSFSNISETYSIEPFLRAGVGYIEYNAELKYEGTGVVIDGKGTGENKDVNMSTFLYYIGGGIKTSLSSNLYVNATLMFNYSPYDYLDVVHNYYSDGTRADLTGIYPEFKIGVFYRFNGKGNSRGENKGGSGGKKRGNHKATFLPFSGVK